MTELVVRRLRIHLETPIAARCNGGDAFRTALFNALSMSLPLGEPYCIETQREHFVAGWRIRLFRDVTLPFLGDLTRQSLVNLAHAEFHTSQHDAAPAAAWLRGQVASFSVVA